MMKLLSIMLIFWLIGGSYSLAIPVSSNTNNIIYVDDDGGAD
jgi:hypothetical protein